MAYALDNRGCGQALPPFLQGRSTMGFGRFRTKPMIPPKSTIVPGEARGWGPGGPQKPTQAPKITPAKSAAPVALNTTGQGAPAQTLYEFFKRDLENQRNASLANARVDAAARGVFYGTPLTTSQGNIETEYNRGLGQLQAGLLQNEQQNELQRLGLATSLLGSTPQASSGGISPDVFAAIGALLAPRQGPIGASTAPQITPAPQQNPLTRENFRR